LQPPSHPPLCFLLLAFFALERHEPLENLFSMIELHTNTRPKSLRSPRVEALRNFNLLTTVQRQSGADGIWLFAA
jgi:hypothetical protein